MRLYLSERHTGVFMGEMTWCLGKWMDVDGTDWLMVDGSYDLVMRSSQLHYAILFIFVYVKNSL